MVAQDLIQQMQVPFDLVDGTRRYAGVSIGISLFPSDGCDAEVLIQQADTALYKAKDAGRNTYRFYTSSHTDSASERLSLEFSLRQALENQEFLLQYQPLIALPGGRAIGAEALVRWLKPDGTMVPPSTFIPLAEETGLIVVLGEWVLREACTRMKQWLDAGHRLETLAVNLSPRQFRHSNLPAVIEAILIETGLPAKHLELEITEGALMETGGETIARLESLKALGVRLSIDDFGTGYSSLAYLKRFPVDKLKVDQSFVRDIPHDTADMEITATIIAMARNLNLRVLAEGIETAGQLDFLNRHQCETGQGFYFSRPIAQNAFEAWLAANHALHGNATVANSMGTSARTDVP
jgi:EAL domain-containing protein (putative c-di-GMP-specific phosphodiesterase class I)